MICPTCQTDSSHIKVIGNRTGCHSCLGFAETGGKTDKILTYNADRITEQHIQNEGDLISPYTIDKSTNQVIVNESFIDKYPDQAATIFKEEELQAAGYGELKPQENDDTGEGIEFVGDESDAIEEVIGG